MIKAGMRFEMDTNWVSIIRRVYKKHGNKALVDFSTVYRHKDGLYEEKFCFCGVVEVNNGKIEVMAKINRFYDESVVDFFNMYLYS